MGFLPDWQCMLTCAAVARQVHGFRWQHIHTAFRKKSKLGLRWQRPTSDHAPRYPTPLPANVANSPMNSATATTAANTLSRGSAPLFCFVAIAC